MKKRVGFFGLALLLIVSTMGLAGHPVSYAAGKKEKIKDLVLYQNTPQADNQITGNEFSLAALKVMDDGSFMKADHVEWQSTNQKVAKVDQHGLIRMTGKQGAAQIKVRDGKHVDHISLRVNQNGKAVLYKQKGKKYDLAAYSLSKMTLEEKIGQMLMPDFRQWNGKDVTAMLPEISKMVKEYHIGGVILFRENVVTTEQTARLIHAYQQSADKQALLMAIDQEGGIVTRLQSGTDLPGNMALGATRSNALAEKAGKVIGEELQALGFNLDLAPVLDVNNNPDNPVIGVRSFGEDPNLVAELGSAYMDGLHHAGMGATAKHFPGHGDTNVDSHVGLPQVNKKVEDLKQMELVPFQRAMNNGLDAVMTAHITFPQIDSTRAISKKTGEEVAVPATLSRKILTGLIRENMGYNGVVITDAMNMGAISEHFGTVDAAVKAVQAGADILLMPVGLEQAANGLKAAVLKGDIPKKQMDESVKRILELKLKRGIIKNEKEPAVDTIIAQALKTVGSEEHKKVEKEAAEKSVTLVKNDGALPIKALGEKETLAVVGRTNIQELGAAIKKYHSNTATIELPDSFLWTPEQQKVLKEATYIIAGSYTSNVEMRSPSNPQMQMINRLQEITDAPVIAVGIRNPYDIMAYPNVNAYLAQYGFKGSNFSATAAAIFGQVNPSGKLPVTLPDNLGGLLYPVGHGLSYR
ncbi:beta-N-acetylhexosaminidase [Bacillus testis]|uniref:beta-N-acetylhexosaminidase n=1 Tax=Bacillus testis TaxID=1622072 RepID=UPI00067EF631|nr:beta-N-acetylhexosaminidase [Bacillus testis]